MIRMSLTTCAVAIVAIAGSLQKAEAAAFSANYCSVAHIVDEPAGVVPLGNWNDFTSVSTLTSGGFAANDTATSAAHALKYDDGSAVASGLSISWASSPGGSQNTNDAVIRPFSGTTTPPTQSHIQDGHDQLMAGYLQAGKEDPSDPFINLTVTGLDLSAFGGTYSLILYLDGDSDVESDTGSFSVAISDQSGGSALSTTVYGRDATTNDFSIDHTVANSLADYTQITSTLVASPTEGNYVRFDGLTSDKFFVEITGQANTHGVALNGFQIIPEPASMVMLGIGGLLALRRTRKA